MFCFRTGKTYEQASPFCGYAMECTQQGSKFKCIVKPRYCPRTGRTYTGRRKTLEVYDAPAFWDGVARRGHRYLRSRAHLYRLAGDRLIMTYCPAGENLKPWDVYELLLKIHQGT